MKKIFFAFFILFLASNVFALGLAPANITASFDNYYRIKVQLRLFNEGSENEIVKIKINSTTIPYECPICDKWIKVPAGSTLYKNYVYTNITFFRPEKKDFHDVYLIINFFDKPVTIIKKYSFVYLRDLDNKEAYVVPVNSTLNYGSLASEITSKEIIKEFSEEISWRKSLLFVLISLIMIIFTIYVYNKEPKIKLFALFILLLFPITFSAPPQENQGTVPPPDLTRIICEEKDTAKGKQYECFTDMKKKLDVFGTEYIPNTKGTFWLQLLDRFQPVDNATCILYSWYPNNSRFIYNASMLFLERGVYYYDFWVPQIEGVYKVVVECKYYFNVSSHFPSSFSILTGTLVSGNLTNLYNIDGNVMEFREAGSGSNRRLTVEFNFTGINITDANSLELLSYGRWNDNNENLRIYVYNPATNSFDLLPQFYSFSNTFVTVNNILPITYVFGNTLRIRFIDDSADSSASSFSLDFLQLRVAKNFTGYINEIRGGGEAHVINIRREILLSQFLNNKEFPIVPILFVLGLILSLLVYIIIIRR